MKDQNWPLGWPKSPKADGAIQHDLEPSVAFNHTMSTASRVRPAFDTVVERDIIPHLLMAMRARRAEPAKTAARTVNSARQDLSTFCRALAQGDIDAAEAHASTRLSSSEREVRSYFTTAARELGRAWEEDDASFAEVTMGLSVLERMTLRRFADQPLPVQHQDPDRSILLAPVPGDGHAFGLLFVEAEFAALGWHVELLKEPTAERLLECVSRAEYGVIGLSISCERSIEPGRRLISELRAASRNPDVRILIGGRIASPSNDGIRSLGADLVFSGNSNSASWVEERLFQQKELGK